MHIHLRHAPDPDTLAHFTQAMPAHVRVTTGPVTPDNATYDILVAGFPTVEELTVSPRLKALVIPWAGLPETTRQSLAHVPDLPVHNIHHNSDAVAETALALLLAVAKQLLLYDARMRRFDWGPRYYAHHDALLLHGKTALVLGYGAIGQRVAQGCQALGMHVMATKRTLPDPPYDGEIALYSSDQLTELLPLTHALLLCLPLTSETHHIIDEAELALLPSHAIVVNVGRGALVAEEPLYRALQSQQIFGAGLDVWYNYPDNDDARAHTPPSRFPFHDLDNVVLSPHRADHCDEIERLRMSHLAALLRPAALGHPLANPLDRKRGY